VQRSFVSPASEWADGGAGGHGFGFTAIAITNPPSNSAEWTRSTSLLLHSLGTFGTFAANGYEQHRRPSLLPPLRQKQLAAYLDERNSVYVCFPSLLTLGGDLSIAIIDFCADNGLALE
jgi:hypothetical protein